jgi:hypothetical protein
VDCIHLALDSYQWRILVKNLMNRHREDEFMQLGNFLVLNKDFSTELAEMLTKISNHGLKSSSPHSYARHRMTLCTAQRFCFF